MDTANYIKRLIDEHRLEEAETALGQAKLTDLTQADRSFIEGLLAAKRGDWKMAKNHFLEAHDFDPDCGAAEMLEMISEIYDFYYKDNLNP